MRKQDEELATETPDQIYNVFTFDITCGISFFWTSYFFFPVSTFPAITESSCSASVLREEISGHSCLSLAPSCQNTYIIKLEYVLLDCVRSSERLTH